ncbi:MAG: precorrin-4 C(11)-methyltransferase [Planctomycetota bacterium]
MSPKVYIVGAGPGDPELMTVKAARLVANAGLVLFTGSLVPRSVVENARPDAEVVDSKGLTLDRIVELMVAAVQRGDDVARVHTGDPSLFGSTAEQVRRLEAEGIEVEIVPGVSSFSAAAAALGRELTLPELSQTVILTRAEGRTPMPENEDLPGLAAHGATLALFLSIGLLDKVVRDLTPSYGSDCPIAVVHRASRADQVVVMSTLEDVEARVAEAGISDTAMILVGRVLTATDFADSRLYAADFSHRFRRAAPRSTDGGTTHG